MTKTANIYKDNSRISMKRLILTEADYFAFQINDSLKLQEYPHF